MSTEFQLPEIGEGVVEGEIVEWFVAAGDRVTHDQKLVSILTDKATVDISATFSGTVTATYGEAGGVVPVGGALLTYQAEGTAPAPAAPAPSTTAAVAVPAATKDAVISFPLPEIGEGVIEGELVTWHVKPGDSVRADQAVVSILTDKATVEINAPTDGVVVATVGEPGALLTVGAEIMTLRVTGVAAQAQSIPATKAPAAAPAAAPSPTPRQVAPADNPSISAFGTPLATPAVRRLAGELGVDLAQVVGSGPNHRILREDVAGFTAAAPVPVAAPAPAAAPVAAPAAVTTAAGDRREKLRGLRKAIYTSMTRSKSTIPHFTYVDEVEMDKLVALRESLVGSPLLGGQKINYLPFVVKAVVLALKQFPALNASVDDVAGELVYKSRYNIGIATATPDGLTVPVLKNADRKNILEISREIGELADRARNRRSTMDDISDGTFTITSLGRLGGLFATPIINHPEVGILGIHNLQERAVVRGGQIVIRQMMNLSVSFDHRVVDGDVGASFAQTVKGFLEEPGSILLSLV